MRIFISSLVGGMKEMKPLSCWINEKNCTETGVECIAFTHDEEYWMYLEETLEILSCPISFHGPFVNVEAASRPESQEQVRMLESYRKVMRLADKYKAVHIVFHYTQLAVKESEKPLRQKWSRENIKLLQKMAEEYRVPLLIENLAFPPDGLPLYDNSEFKMLMHDFPESQILLDIGHAHINKMDLEPFLREFGHRVRAYHFHNNNGREDQHNRIVDGSFDYQAFADLYKKFTPDKDIVLEYEPHTRAGTKELEADISFIRKYYTT